MLLLAAVRPIDVSWGLAVVSTLIAAIAVFSPALMAGLRKLPAATGPPARAVLLALMLIGLPFPLGISAWDETSPGTLIIGLSAPRPTVLSNASYGSDIEPARLDPVEHAILALGLWELMARPEVPFRVVINEGIELAKRFGATDGHRYVNAVLDRASRAHRGAERGEVA